MGEYHILTKHPEVTAQPFLRTKGLPSSTQISTNQQFFISRESDDLMKVNFGNCTQDAFTGHRYSPKHS